MAGIAGIIHQDLRDSRFADSQRMLRQMCHDGSWNSGLCNVDPLRLTAGWVSEQGSFSDCMPAWNEDRSVCLIITGEEFGVGDELLGLKTRGHKDIQPRASALVHWYEEQGPGLFSRLNGWYSGVLVDLRAENVTLFNDRYGLNRLYYHESRDGFYFASEAKSILAVLPHLRRIDQRCLAEFLSVGCVLQNRSLFAGVSILPGGSCWTIHRDGRIEKRRYFEPSTWEQQAALDPVAYCERLAEVFARVAPHYIRGGTKVAMSLTGGLDSRMILAWARAVPGSLPCYTFGGPYRDCADVHIARKLAAISKQPHTTIRIENDFFANFSALAEKTVYLSDGAMDVSGSIELYANQLARKIAPIRITGNYGSEILRSNVAFRPRQLAASLFTPEFQALIRTAGETYDGEAAGHRLSFIAFKQVPWHHFARFSIEKSQLTPRSPFLDNELVALAYQAPPDLKFSPEPMLRAIARGNPAFASIGTDRALRARSIPFVGKIARTWQDFTAKAEYAYDYGMPAWLARTDRVLRPLHLERLFLGRHKFYHFRVWYRDHLSSALQTDGFGFARQPSCYVDGAAKKLVREHTSGRDNHTLELHQLLTVQLIERLFAGPPCRT